MAHRKELIKEDIARLQARYFVNLFFFTEKVAIA